MCWRISALILLTHILRFYRFYSTFLSQKSVKGSYYSSSNSKLAHSIQYQIRHQKDLEVTQVKSKNSLSYLTTFLTTYPKDLLEAEVKKFSIHSVDSKELIRLLKDENLARRGSKVVVGAKLSRWNH